MCRKEKEDIVYDYCGNKCKNNNATPCEVCVLEYWCSNNEVSECSNEELDKAIAIINAHENDFVQPEVERIEESKKSKTGVPWYEEGRKYKPKDVISDWGLNFNLGSVVKYVARCGRKPDNSMLKDLNKAKDYIEYEIEVVVEKLREGGVDEVL